MSNGNPTAITRSRFFDRYRSTGNEPLVLPPNLGIGIGKAEYLPTGHSGPSRIESEPATGYSQNGLFDPPPRNILDPMHGCHFVERIKTCIGSLDAVVARFSGNLIETENHVDV